MHYSPQVALLECVASSLLFFWCIFHTYKFDKFESLAVWRRSSFQAVFRRSMVIIYLLGLPMFAVSGAIMAVIKYRNGYLPSTMGGNPVPYNLWTPIQKSWIEPLAIMYSVAWICEVIVHLEETCFWWYLLTLEPHSGGWFVSKEVKAFGFFSVASIAGLLIPPLLNQEDHIRTEALTTTIGAAFVVLQNIVFCRFLWIFPDFILVVSAGQTSNGDSGKIATRLSHFHDQNKIRVTFRFLFGLPALALGIDGLSFKYLNTRVWIVDLMMMTLFLSFCVQSLITYLIFLPTSKDHPELDKIGRNRHAQSSFFSDGHDKLTTILPSNMRRHEHRNRLATSVHGAAQYPPATGGHVSVSVGRAYFDMEGSAVVGPHEPGRTNTDVYAGGDAIEMDGSHEKFDDPYASYYSSPLPHPQFQLQHEQPAQDQHKADTIVGRWVTPISSYPRIAPEWAAVTTHPYTFSPSEDEQRRNNISPASTKVDHSPVNTPGFAPGVPIRGRRPSLILRPKLHPALSSFRSPIDIDV